MENNSSLTITSLAPLIRRREISPVELTTFLLDRISLLQPSINAYITITADAALAQARRAEKEILKGEYRGPLHGIPISLKDLFHTRGIRTTAGSKILREFVPEENAAVVDRLLDAGCIILGKTNMHEFAYGPTNLNPHYGHVRNPWNLDRMSGGSSGGSAASVVTALALGSFGTDTGGSIRIPAAACGCVGLKPTYGLVPLEGVIPLATTLDHPGPLARCVSDAALLLEAVAEPKLWKRNDTEDPAGLRIGIPRHYFFDHIQPEVQKAVMAAVTVFEQLGARISEVDLEGMSETQHIASIITGTEACAYHHEWIQRQFADYGEDVGTRLKATCDLPASVYEDALQEKRAYSDRLDTALTKVDLLIAPALPATAPLLTQETVSFGQAIEDVRSALLRLTRPGNLSGLPAITVPCGFSDGLPIGLQLIGRRFDEATLLRAASSYESATDWHHDFPPDIFSHKVN